MIQNIAMSTLPIQTEWMPIQRLVPEIYCKFESEYSLTEYREPRSHSDVGLSFSSINDIHIGSNSF